MTERQYPGELMHPLPVVVTKTFMGFSRGVRLTERTGCGRIAGDSIVTGPRRMDCDYCEGESIYLSRTASLIAEYNSSPAFLGSSIAAPAAIMAVRFSGLAVTANPMTMVRGGRCYETPPAVTVQVVVAASGNPCHHLCAPSDAVSVTITRGRYFVAADPPRFAKRVTPPERCESIRWA